MLCTICARGGSKGVTNKHLREINGIPLIGYTISQAKECGLFEFIAVSSDSKNILDCSKDFGVNYLCHRPYELASDTAPKLPVIRHAVQSSEKYFGKEFPIIVDLDASAPLRLSKDIIGATNLIEHNNKSNVITAAKARRSPYFNLIEISKEGKVTLSKTLQEKVFRRQDAPMCYDMNASIYVWEREALFENQTLFTDNTKLFVMPESRSIDVDSEFDMKLVSYILENGLQYDT